jgi:AmiR/NasT family two-component response regulator
MAEEIEQLHLALHTRDIIGQAKGVFIERFRIDAGEAFQLLVRLSQESNTPVAQVARALVEGSDPGAD